MTNNPYIFRQYIDGDQFKMGLFCSDLSTALNAGQDRALSPSDLESLYRGVHSEDVSRNDIGAGEDDASSLSACFICFAEWMHAIGECLGHEPVYGDSSGDYWVSDESGNTLSVVSRLKDQLVSALATVNSEIENASGISPVDEILQSRNYWRQTIPEMDSDSFR
ncbi:hypothetical protein [Hydrocarboniclastica marina]|uniref:Uncharacterized protein n=1 Tax=Hydrocarboniclastica marina TaxID=2259620 RepID=A0A4P7XLI3_9ALTE|nr:hypothetical protein [Hydrocarboniclastica marina]QCF28109.1 hypothetical protein soil367_18735 [Hydrocarboniclastica marina]